ncbi:MAG: 16S rRNA (uracil(1498)-N(3))-methyltransferase [Verrucomicrobia bacterium]|nr:16S rRNA (uracil(1498)-N(3))-methyltransferase [Verrucomicrobiota bacterium]MCH8528989.1 16S rRNA (uracil(1498)-N(3))-methyltransferase [Kiritimatiellia bacterium]
MNRILYRQHEPVEGLLTLQDARADHIRKVLRARPGDTLKLGRLNGPLAQGVIETLDPQAVVLRLTEGETPPRPGVDLLLALPRPKVLRRLLPQIAALGVGRLFLTNAARVERPYFDTHVLDPAPLETALIEGLTQAGDTRLPEVRVIRRLKIFLEDELDTATDAARRLVLHPGRGTPLHRLPESSGRTLLAIGPEGGWIPHELDRFAALGFVPATLGPRILRTDTATLAALAIASAE